MPSACAGRDAGRRHAHRARKLVFLARGTGSGTMSWSSRMWFRGEGVRVEEGARVRAFLISRARHVASGAIIGPFAACASRGSARGPVSATSSR